MRVRHCRGECGEAITGKTILVVRSFGDVPVYDSATGKHTITKGNHYIHFRGSCLKDYDAIQTNHFYRDDEDFPYGKIELDPASKALLTQADIDGLTGIGVRV